MARKAKIDITRMNKKSRPEKKTVLIITFSVIAAIAVATALLIIFNRPEGTFEAALKAIDNTFKGKTAIELTSPGTEEKYVLCADKDNSYENYYLLKEQSTGELLSASGKYDGYYFDYENGTGEKTKTDIMRSVLIDGVLMTVIKDGTSALSISRIIESNSLLSSFVDKEKAEECFDELIKKANDGEWLKEFLGFELEEKEVVGKPNKYYYFRSVNLKKIADELYGLFKPSIKSEIAESYAEEYISGLDDSETVTVILQVSEELIRDVYFGHTYKAYDSEAKVNYDKSYTFEFAVNYENDSPVSIIYEASNSTGEVSIDSVNKTVFDAEKAADILGNCKLKISFS